MNELKGNEENYRKYSGNDGKSTKKTSNRYENVEEEEDTFASRKDECEETTEYCAKTNAESEIFLGKKTFI